MKPTRKLSRRSFLGRVAGGAILGGGALMAVSDTASALQCSDSDSGPNSDPPGRGRSCGGCSDSDSGPNSDPGGRGRSCGADPPAAAIPIPDRTAIRPAGAAAAAAEALRESPTAIPAAIRILRTTGAAGAAPA